MLFYEAKNVYKERSRLFKFSSRNCDSCFSKKNCLLNGVIKCNGIVDLRDLLPFAQQSQVNTRAKLKTQTEYVTF